jgi:putative PIN family toxin of toxin-antitoxin system
VSPRVVYDTMVFYQWAVLPEGRVHRTAHAVLDGAVRLCLSAELVSEVKDLLNRPAIRDHSVNLTTERTERFIDTLMKRAEWFPAIARAFTWPRHPDDDHLFNLAIAAQARFLVTWEKRILGLATEQSVDAERLRSLASGLSIISPAELGRHLANP